MKDSDGMDQFFVFAYCALAVLAVVLILIDAILL